MPRPINILITGSNYWNIGDDIVRDGAMALLRASLFPREVNWLFYDFSRAQNALGSCGEVPNTVEIRDLSALHKHIDLVVVPGLAFGKELAPLFQALNDLKLGPKTIFLGGMNENQYAAQWAQHTPTRRLVKEALLVVGRTKAHPDTLRRDGVQYHCLPCPSILCDFQADFEPRAGVDRISFSIQLPHGTPGGVVNHTTSAKAHDAALSALKESVIRFPDAEISLVCHHKSEYAHWHTRLDKSLGIQIVFSSWYQDVWHHYRQADVILSTRLHAVLLGRASGIPGVVINDSPRHLHALAEFRQQVAASLDPVEILNFVSSVRDPAKLEAWRDRARMLRDETWASYQELLAPIAQRLKDET